MNSALRGNAPLAAKSLSQLSMRFDAEYRPTGSDDMKKSITGCPLFTCGYQGRSAADLCRSLSAEGVRLIVDVRYRPFSRKPGFSKSALKSIAATHGLHYCHVGSLGIPDADRKDPALKPEAFERYQSRMSVYAPPELGRVTEISRRFPVVLLCFESEASECHRSLLAKTICRVTGTVVVDL